MSDQLTDSAERLFAAQSGKDILRSAEAGTWPQGLWDAVEQAGFTAALLPEAAGGFGATPVEAMGLLRTAAAHAAPIPLAETMLAGWLLAKAGLPVPPGPLSLAPVRRADALILAGGRVGGTARRVPWGRNARAVVVVADGQVACVPAAASQSRPAATSPVSRGIRSRSTRRPTRLRVPSHRRPCGRQGRPCARCRSPGR